MYVLSPFRFHSSVAIWAGGLSLPSKIKRTINHQKSIKSLNHQINILSNYENIELSNKQIIKLSNHQEIIIQSSKIKFNKTELSSNTFCYTSSSNTDISSSNNHHQIPTRRLANWHTDSAIYDKLFFSNNAKLFIQLELKNSVFLHRSKPISPTSQ